MTTSQSNNNLLKPLSLEARRIIKYRTVLMLFWTFIIALFSYLLFKESERTVEKIAISEARAAISRDILYRRWGSMQGGFYVTPTDHTPPNPYLSHLPKRDVTTTDGDLLTLINPAYMTRQVYEMARRSSTGFGTAHLTSLKPLRPENAPDQWEKSALTAFENGAKEFKELQKSNGNAVIRLMQPFVTEESCLKCHAFQGYKVGDVRGGLSVSIPVQPLLDATNAQRKETLAGYALLWLCGLILFWFGGKKLWVAAEIKQKNEDEMHFLTKQLEEEIAERQMTQEELQSQASLLEEEIAERHAAQDSLQEQAAVLEEEILERQQAQESLSVKSAQLETLNQQLEDRVSKIVDELRKKDQLLIQQGRLAAMGEMINNIAHQWRQPLNNVGLLIQNLQLEFSQGTLTSKEMDTVIDNAMSTILYMSKTIDDFRNFFRTDKQKETFLPHAVTKKTLDFIGITLENQGVSITTKMSENVSAFGYPNEYAQVILNILSNSRDVFTERSVENPQITITITDENGKSKLTISDNGGGIDESILPKIFDPYFTTKEPGKGTGIGLYMSKIIIEQNMGGTLSARNYADGVEFIILL